MIDTMTLDEFIALGFNPFSFNYAFTTVTLDDGTVIDKDYLENEFIEYYAHYPIVFGTWEQFYAELRRRWKKEIGPFNRALRIMPTVYNLNDRGMKTTQTVARDQKYSDTPNQPMDTSTNAYLTTRTLDDGMQTAETNESKNDLIQFDRLKRLTADLTYEFLDKYISFFITQRQPAEFLIPKRSDLL